MPTTDLPDNPDRIDLADTRTVWAEDRTALADERTFAGWMRSGVACIAIALGFQVLFGSTEYPIATKSAAEAFIVAGIFVFSAAAAKSRKTRKRMKEHGVETGPGVFMTILAIILTLAAINAGGVL